MQKSQKTVSDFPVANWTHITPPSQKTKTKSKLTTFQQSAAHLAEDPAALAIGLLHHAEDGEVPIVELSYQGIQVVHQ